MLKKILAGGVLALALFGVVSCGAKQPSKIVIASDATFPPMEMVDENKAIVGLDVDLMNAAAKAGGFTVEFKNTASMPYFNAGQILVVKSDVNGVQSLADLKGKTVGAQIGTTGAFEIDKVKDANKITPKTYDEIGLAFEDLVNGRIAGVVVDTPTAANYALQNPNYKGKLKTVGAAFTQEFYGVAVKKGNTKVLDLINAGLKKVLDAGDNKAIEQKWLQ